MMVRAVILLVLSALPAQAATGPFFSLQNTNFVVLIAFIAFLALLTYMGVWGRLTGMLDARAQRIRAELDEARALREEAKTILASYERKQAEVQEQADRIVTSAREEALAAAAQAKADLATSIARRVAAAEEQIGAAEAQALKQVRERAVSVAVVAATEVLSAQKTAASAKDSLDAAIQEVEARLH
jgi:F-type H+-transporting ATPase subunit b